MSGKYRKTKKLINTNKEKYNVEQPVSFTLDQKIEIIQDCIHHTDDLYIREIKLAEKVFKILFIDSIVDEKGVETNIIKPLLNSTSENVLQVITSAKMLTSTNIELAAEMLAKGYCLVLEESVDTYFMIPLTKEHSNRVEPGNERIIRGSHQGFGENITENLQFIRERISSADLTIKRSRLGKTSQSTFALVYLSDLANQDTVKRIENRLSYIETDSIQAPGYFEEFLEENSYSPFPQFLNTERTDRVVGNLMEGRIALIMDGCPTALIFPVSFFSFFQTSEDYNNRSFIASFFRIIRIFSFITTLCLPAFYIALISYNYEIIPVEIVFPIKSSLEFIPFPPLIEATIMQLTLELLREAAIRLPNPIAQTIGVVGGLVIGTAVVEANLVSNTMVIVVAITAISSFVIPSSELSTTIRILGFPLMLCSSLFGVFGIVIGLMIILIHMSKLKSLGHPYLYPLAPLDLAALKDILIRVPLWLLQLRPKDLKTQYRWRMSKSRGWEKDEEESD
ncbi:spore germination protein [Bacillus sp. CH30_1T]|uniref:spore germination protein n=1 Tax=Bacillus sp. CH30_1T TaxID=2604836 RepID=UPI0011EC5F5B|nr:spore germination protein [Bacillus sp. CH30_1T]KAA0563518.1 spore germination protein [Bacillus sp. CH30_1T]